MIGTSENFPTVLIKHTGKFDLKKLYKLGPAWFEEHKYDFTEKEHTVKEISTGQQNVFTWITERKLNDFFKLHIDTRFFMNEIIKNKDGTVNGSLIIRVMPWLEMDWQKKWQGNPMSKFLFYVYTNYVIKREIKQIYDTKLFLEYINYVNTIKKELGLLN